MHYPFNKEKDYYAFANIDDFIFECVNYKERRYKDKEIEYYNVAVSFDIESSSLYIDSEQNQIDAPEDQGYAKFATMYIWHFCYDGYVLYGRTWQEFIKTCEKLSRHLELSENRCIIVYVHNLAFDFQFFRKWFKFTSVFSTDRRKPLYARTTHGIEFRDSLILSALSLEMVGKQLQRYKREKLVGDLNYRLIRHSKTPMSDTELAYCINDVLVLAYYVAEQIEEYKYITKIPLTNTSRVRNYVRNVCYGKVDGGKQNKYKKYEYRELMKYLQIQSNDEYHYIKQSFMGGFTHANLLYVNETLTNVTSMDLTSDYPSQFFNLFPMSPGKKVAIMSKDHLNELLRKYCCVFYVTFEKLAPRFANENIISQSKCLKLINPIVNNGRVMYADVASMVINELDYKAIQQFYTCEKQTIGDFYIYQKGFLPKPIMSAMLDLYKTKTLLKGVEGEDNYLLYMRSKGMLNSLYGMMVTAIVHENIDYDNDWMPITNPDLSEALNRYNNDKSRFTFYLWGCYITSYARQTLYQAILELNDDYIYSDTDSVKFLNYDKHKAYFDTYNQQIEKKLEYICNRLNLDCESIRPCDIDGVKHVLGTWDNEGTYKRFKTLGAKRYIYETDDGIHTTVAGIGKKALKNYLLEDCKKDPFTAFDDSITVPANKSGKLTHTYIDIPMQVKVKDYLGNENVQYELSSVHLENTSFDLSGAGELIRFALGMRNNTFTLK